MKTMNMGLAAVKLFIFGTVKSAESSTKPTMTHVVAHNE